MQKTVVFGENEGCSTLLFGSGKNFQTRETGIKSSRQISDNFALVKKDPKMIQKFYLSNITNIAKNYFTRRDGGGSSRR